MPHEKIGEFGIATQFATDNQPDPKLKSKGWLKRKRGRELIQAILEMDFHGLDPEFKSKAAAYFQVELSEITNEMMIVFTQVVRAAQKADTGSFDLLMTRAYGKPKDAPAETEEGELPDVKIEVIQVATNEDTPPIADTPDDEDRPPLSKVD